MDKKRSIGHTNETEHEINADGDIGFIEESSANQSGKKKKFEQESITKFLPKNFTPSAKSKIDMELMSLFTKDLQPFSVVNDDGFKSFVKSLNPNYSLPCKKTLTETFLPEMYEQCVCAVKQLLHNEAKAVTVTTDTWTSVNNESYIGVTVHFVDVNFKIQSVMLDCSLLIDSHTSGNLAQELQTIFNYWEISNKIQLVVTDNAPNIVKAIKDMKLKHLGCFAHTINLIVKRALTHVESELLKIRTIVGYFKRSSKSNKKLKEYQRRNGCTHPQKVLQDVATGWNSTYYMIERFVELKDGILATLAVVDHGCCLLSSDEWTLLNELKTVLKPMESLTKDISGQNYLTASLVIVLVKGLRDLYKKLEKESFSCSPAKCVVQGIKKGIDEKFEGIENSLTLRTATFLDPRFKNVFFEEKCQELIKQNIAGILTHKMNNKKDKMSGLSAITSNDPSTSNSKENSVWIVLDSISASHRPQGSSTSKAIVEIQRYLEEGLVDRRENALEWWSTNFYLFPNLSLLVKENTAVVSTSVPCERLFSKAGELTSKKRSRLAPDKVKKLLFLNTNMKYCN